MKYQKQLAIVGGLAVGAVAVYYLVKLSTPTPTRGVTAVTKGPTGDALTTTKIQPSAVAVAAPQTTLSLMAQSAARAFRTALSGVLPARTDRMQSYANPVSAEAAYTAPVETSISNYRPSAYAVPIIKRF